MLVLKSPLVSSNSKSTKNKKPYKNVMNVIDPSIQAFGEEEALI
jgi:hypothetical protein